MRIFLALLFAAALLPAIEAKAQDGTQDESHSEKVMMMV